MSTNPSTIHGPRKLTKHDIMGIRYVTDPPADGGDPPADPPAPTPDPPKPAPPAPAPADPIEGSLDGGKTFTPEYVQTLRAEAAKNRVDAKDEIQRQIDEAVANGQKAWATELGKKLGILEGDKEKSPDEIIAELKAERDSFKTNLETLTARDIARNELDAINTASDTHGGDNALVRAVVKADDLLKDIDPTADDYAAQVEAVVKAQIEKNTKLQKVQVAPSSGGEQRPTGSTTTGEPKTIEERRKAIRDNRAAK